jgi:hypothetical protein
MEQSMTLIQLDLPDLSRVEVVRGNTVVKLDHPLTPILSDYLPLLALLRTAQDHNAIVPAKAHAQSVLFKVDEVLVGKLFQRFVRVRELASIWFLRSFCGLCISRSELMRVNALIVDLVPKLFTQA